MRKLPILAVAAAAMSLTGCADTYPLPSSNTLMVINTEPSMSAHCTLDDNNGSWDIYDTPSSIDFVKARGALVIRCKSHDGWEGGVIVTSKVEPLFVGASVAAGAAAGVGIAVLSAPTVVVGAALVGVGVGGGALGGVAGVTTGMAYKYPNVVTVPMVNTIQAIPAAVMSAPAPVVVQEAPVAPPPRSFWRPRHRRTPVVICAPVNGVTPTAH
jgi:hypothetical protein